MLDETHTQSKAVDRVILRAEAAVRVTYESDFVSEATCRQGRRIRNPCENHTTKTKSRAGR